MTEADLNNLEAKTESVLKELCTAFHANSKIILTESDLKCRLFAAFLPTSDEDVYSVHSEITHYKKPLSSKKKTYNFRDMSLLSKKAVLENKDAEAIWDKQKSLSKGFLHKGPAIHFELKFIRQAQNPEQLAPVPTGDIENLKFYMPGKIERRFVVIWGSRSDVTKVPCMVKTFLAAFNGNNNSRKKFMEAGMKQLVSAFIFDKEELVYGKWDEAEFKFKSITTK